MVDYDILTLGSASLDIFIKAKSEVRKHEHHTDISYHLGEKVLIDDLEFTTGGGGTNNAVGFSRLGLKTGFIGVVGNDDNSHLILDDLRKEGVDFLGSKKKGKSGFSVILAGKKDRTILAYKGVNNNLEYKDAHIKDVNANWLYVTTMLGKSTKAVHKIMKKFKTRGSKIGVNISHYLAKQGIESNKKLLRLADVLIMNLEEAECLTKKMRVEEMFDILKKYTLAKIVITNGAYNLYAFDGKDVIMKKVKDIKPVDTTGAGDAFATGFVFGIIKGKDIHTCLEYGHKEASSNLMSIGAKTGLLRRL